MKKQNVFIALFLAAFMLLLFGNVSSADPMMAPAGGPNDHHAGGPNDHHGVDCAALPTPEEVTACENGPQAQYHDPNIMPPDLVGVGPGAPVEPPM